MSTIEPRALASEIASGSPGTILDVRSGAEFTSGHLPGAIHIPFWSVARFSHLPGPREARIVVYCGHGPRAWIAGAALRRHGFRHVVYLAGHMAAWRRARLPLETETGSRK